MKEIEFIKELYKNPFNENEEYSITGRVASVRKHGKIMFLDIVDHTGKIQVVVDKKALRDVFEEIKNISTGSYVSINGFYKINHRNQPEIAVDSIEVLAKATLPLSPSPWKIDATDPKYGRQVFGLPSFYLANPQRAAVLKIKTDFIQGLHQYFQKHNFTLVEPPILTEKTLYSDDNAVQAKVHGEDIFLTQCATFELEPLAMVYKKVYTISPAFRNEKGGSKRHLAEYTHAKAEAIQVTLEDLMLLAGESIYEGVKYMVDTNRNELRLLEVDIDLEALHPDNHVRMTYDEALKIISKKGSNTEWGGGLTRRDEIILSDYVDNKYLWVMFPPFESEGFPYKRHPKNRKLSVVADLIAPHGSGEMVGVAEKITDPEEIIQNLIEKGKKNEIKRYWEYILLRFYGMPPHGGLGAAPERIIYGLLDLDHIRLTKPYPRYPDRKIATWWYDDLNPWNNSELERIIDKYDVR